MKNYINSMNRLFVSATFFCLIVIPIKSFGTVTIRLKNGNPMEGKLISVEDGKVTFETGGMQLTLPKDKFYAPDTEWFQEAQDAQSHDNFTRASELCKQILIWNPDDPKAKDLLDQVKQKQNEVKLAKEKEDAEKKAEIEKAAADKAKADALAQAEVEEARKKPMEILKKVSNTFKNIKSYQADGVLTVETKAQGMNNSMDVPVSFAEVRPDKVKFIMKNPMAEIQMMSDGKFTWMYMPQEKQYIKIPGSMKDLSEKMGTNINEESSELTEYEKITEDVKSVELLREETIPFGNSSVDCYVIRLEKQSKEENPLFEDTPKLYWFDKSTFIPVKEVEMKVMKARPVTVKTTALMKSIKLNESIPDSYFVFVPPPDAKEEAIPGGSEKEYANFSGKQAQDFTLNSLDGKAYNLNSQRGKVVLVDFWASWCPPCREELPTIEKLHRELKDKGLVVLGVNNEKSETARDFVQKNNYTFPVLMDTQNTVSQQYQVEAIPTVLVIGKDGIVKAHFVGGKSEMQLRAALKVAGIE